MSEITHTQNAHHRQNSSSQNFSIAGQRTTLASPGLLSLRLADLNEQGINPVLVGTDAHGRPFLAYGWAPGGDGWDVGVVTDDPHSSEFDYSDGTERCQECGAFERRPATVLSYPVTILAVAR